MPDRHFAAAAQRNAGPILEALRAEFANRRHVLEIGSGTGQHAVTFAAALPHLVWQTSDLVENHAGIESWIADSALDNVRSPLRLDVCKHDVGASRFDAAFSANTAHIMTIEAVECMFRLLGGALDPAGVFCLYGPFRVGGEFNTSSNAAFDADLRRRSNDRMGIRDLESLDEFARARGMRRVRLYALPANNYLAVWHKED